MSTIEEIRNCLSEESDLSPCLDALRNWTKQHLPAKENEVILFQNRYNALLQGINSFLFTQEEADVKAAQIVKAVLDQMDKYQKELLKKSSGGSVNDLADTGLLHESHKYTCNREQQYLAFDQVKKNAPEDKPIFYYLYGDELHRHNAFFRRLTFEMEGGLLVLENQALKVPHQVYHREIAIKKKPDLESYKVEMASRIFKAFELLPDAHAPLEEKDISYVMEHSPILNQQRLTNEDYICIYARIHQFHWDSKLTPLATRWFINEFCKLPLPPESPRLLFFLGLEYDELSPSIHDEVSVVVKASDIVNELPKLEKVVQPDLQEWLLSYQDILNLTVSQRRDILRSQFSANDFYMDEILPILEELIDNFNNQQD